MTVEGRCHACGAKMYLSLNEAIEGKCLKCKSSKILLLTDENYEKDADIPD